MVLHGFRSLGFADAQLASVESAVAHALSKSDAVRKLIHQPQGSVECANDRLCHCETARTSGADQIVFGNLARLDQLTTIEITLVDAHSCETIKGAFSTETLAEDAVPVRVSAMASELLTPPDSVSETASKVSRPIDETPQLVTVITAKQIQDLGITSVDELLRLVPGFEVIDTNSQDAILLHGLSTTVLFLIDGVPLENPKAGIRSLRRDLALSLNSIDRVEFVRTPGSVQWGPNALLGVVNFITRSPRQSALSVRAHARYGTLDTAEGHVAAEGAARSIRYAASVTARTSTNPTSLVQNSTFARQGMEPGEVPIWGNGGFTGTDADRYLDIGLKLGLWDRLELGLQHFQFEEAFQISPSGSLLEPDAPGSFQKSHTVYRASWKDKLTPSFGYQLSLSRHEHMAWEELMIHPASPEGLAGGLVSMQGNQVEPQLQQIGELRLFHDSELGFVRNHALIGLYYLWQQIPTNYATVSEIDAMLEPVLDFKSSTTKNVSAFGQDTIQLGPLTAFGGGRVEDRAEQGNIFSTAGGLAITSRYVGGKLAYTEGFRSPPANLLYSTSSVRGDTTLRPEKSRAVSGELTVRPLPELRLSGGAMAAKMFDLIGLDASNPPPGFTSVPYNGDELDIYSAFAVARAELGLWSAGASYAYRYMSRDLDTRGAPHSGSGWVIMRPLNDVSAFAIASAESPRHVQLRIPIQQAGDPDLRLTEVRPTFRLDLGVTLNNLYRDLDLDLKIDNPFLIKRESPYQNGVNNTTELIELRRYRQIFLTVRWER